MKVAIIQNLANSMFPRVAFLRENGIDASLFVGYTRRDAEGKPLPEPSQDPFFLTGKRYDWVRYLDFSSQTRPFFFNRNVLADFDIVHSCCMAPIVNQFFLGGKKLIVLANGSDLRSYCFRLGLMPALLRRAYRKADLLVYVQLDQGTIEAIRALKLTRKARFLEHLIVFPEIQTEEISADRKKLFEIFYPSGLRDKIKGTSIFIEAFTRLVHERPECRLHLIDYGQDRKMIRQKIIDLGIAQYVRWHEFANLAELGRLYCSCDVVIGFFRHQDLGVPHYPQVPLQGFYFGKAVVSSYDEAATEHYGAFPALHANSPKEVFDHLMALYDDRSYCEDTGRKAMEWFRKNCSKEKITQDLIEIYREVD